MHRMVQLLFFPFGEVRRFVSAFVMMLLAINVFSQDTTRINRVMEAASILIDNSDYSGAEKKIDTIFMLSNLANYKLGVGEAYNLKGSVYRDQGNFKAALENFLEAGRIFEKYGTKTRVAATYNNIGLIYGQLQENKMALNYYFKAVRLFKEMNQLKFLGILYNNIGTCYQRLKQFGTSHYYLVNSLQIRRQVKDTVGIAMSLHNIGENFQDNREYDSSLAYYQHSLDYLKHIGEGIGHIYNYSQMGISFFHKGDLRKAEHYLLEAYRISNENAVPVMNEQILETLSALYEKKGDYKKALEYHKIFMKQSDSLSNEASHNEIVRRDMENKFEKEKEIQQQQQRSKDIIAENQISNQRKVIVIAMVALGIVSLLVLLVFRGYKQKQKANEIISEQKELVERKNDEILSSIKYARRIQQALITNERYIDQQLKRLSGDEKKGGG